MLGCEVTCWCTAREKDLAVNRQRGPARHPGDIGTGQQDTSQCAQLGLQQAVRVGEVHRFEGVAADQLGQTIGLMRRSPDLGTHLVQGYPDATLRERPRRLRAGKTSADDGGVHASATSSGSATTTRWPHLRQVRLSPSALLIFFSMPSHPQAGQVSGTGRFQVEKSQAG